MSIVNITLVAPFALVIFFGVWHALRDSPFAKHSLLLSVAVTALCLVGIFGERGGAETQVSPQPRGAGFVPAVLLPYAALGISLVFAVVLAFLSRVADGISCVGSEKALSKEDTQIQNAEQKKEYQRRSRSLRTVDRTDRTDALLPER